MNPEDLLSLKTIIFGFKKNLTPFLLFKLNGQQTFEVVYEITVKNFPFFPCFPFHFFQLCYCILQIGPIAELRWQTSGKKTTENNNIAIHVIPPDGEEDDEFVPPLRPRRKLSTPLAALPGTVGTAPGKILRASICIT